MLEGYEKEFEGKRIMITGGLGFIGSNLAHKLVSLKPEKVVIVDSLVPGLGGNPYNIEDIKDKVKLVAIDIRNKPRLEKPIKEVDYIFNLAGSVSHTGSKENPQDDLDINLASHVGFLECCRKTMKNREKNFKIVYTGTRDQYGKVPKEYLPVKEEQIIFDATDPQGIHKYAAEHHHLWYAKNFGFEACSLRLTNTYGPRQQMEDPGRGFLNWFMRKAVDDEEIQLWGGGKSLRDFNYVDDVVDALLMAMVSDKTNGEVYNLGSYVRRENGRWEYLCGNILTVKEIAELTVKIAGSGRCKEIPWPEGTKNIEPGHFYADITKISNSIGWEPKIDLENGLRKTIDFYKKNKEHYW